MFFVIKMGFCPTNHELPAPLTGTRLLAWVLEQPKGTWNGTPTASVELWLNDDTRVLPEMTWQANEPSARHVFKMYVRGKDKKDTRVAAPRASRRRAADASGRLPGPSAASAASGRLPGPAEAAAGAASSSVEEIQVWASAPEKSNGEVKKAAQFGNQIQIHYDDETTARKEFKSIVKEHGLKLHMDMEEAKKRMERLRREMAVLKGYTAKVEERSESDIEFQEEEPEEEEQDEIDEVVLVDATEEEEDADSIENAMTAIADAAKDLKKSKK